MTYLFLLTVRMTCSRHHQHPRILKTNRRVLKYGLTSKKLRFFKDNRKEYRRTGLQYAGDFTLDHYWLVAPFFKTHL